MKGYILSAIVLLAGVQLQAQQQFGAANFNVPAGWSMSNKGSSVVLEKSASRGETCRIIIYSTENGATNTEKAHTQHRNAKGGGYTYNAGTNRYDGNGLVSFFSKGSLAESKLPVYSYFYTLSNGTQTLCYQLLTTSNACIEEFNLFAQSLTMNVEEATGGEKNKAPVSTGRGRKSAPAAPAAPAPMM